MVFDVITAVHVRSSVGVGIPQPARFMINENKTLFVFPLCTKPVITYIYDRRTVIDSSPNSSIPYITAMPAMSKQELPKRRSLLLLNIRSLSSWSTYLDTVCDLLCIKFRSKRLMNYRNRFGHLK